MKTTIAVRRVATVALVALPLAGVVSAGSAGAASKKAVVHIKDIDFSPKALKVKKGTTVTWRFEDGASFTPHNVTSTGKKRFKSSTTKQDGTYSVKFTKKGTYTYVCTIHLNMKAKIIVS